MRRRYFFHSLVFAVVFSLVVPGLTHAEHPTIADTSQPLTPLAQLLNQDGTLNLTCGFSGALNTSGWTMHTGSTGQPRFTPSVDTAQNLPAAVPDDAAWDRQFGLPGVNGRVSAIAVSGKDVYAGGSFTQAGNVWASSIARWDGDSWSSLGSGVSRQSGGVWAVNALEISGNDLYVGGDFDTAGGQPSLSFARWDTRQLTHVFLPAFSW